MGSKETLFHNVGARSCNFNVIGHNVQGRSSNVAILATTRSLRPTTVALYGHSQLTGEEATGINWPNLCHFFSKIFLRIKLLLTDLVNLYPA